LYLFIHHVLGLVACRGHEKGRTPCEGADAGCIPGGWDKNSGGGPSLSATEARYIKVEREPKRVVLRLLRLLGRLRGKAKAVLLPADGQKTDRCRMALR